MLARDDERVADRMDRASHVLRVLLSALWVLFLFVWPVQIICAPFLPHRWFGQAPRKGE